MTGLVPKKQKEMRKKYRYLPHSCMTPWDTLVIPSFNLMPGFPSSLNTMCSNTMKTRKYCQDWKENEMLLENCNIYIIRSEQNFSGGSWWFMIIIIIKSAERPFGPISNDLKRGSPLNCTVLSKEALNFTVLCFCLLPQNFRLGEPILFFF